MHSSRKVGASYLSRAGNQQDADYDRHERRAAEDEALLQRLLARRRRNEEEDAGSEDVERADPRRDRGGAAPSRQPVRARLIRSPLAQHQEGREHEQVAQQKKERRKAEGHPKDVGLAAGKKRAADEENGGHNPHRDEGEVRRLE